MSDDKETKNSPPHSLSDLLVPKVWAIRIHLKWASFLGVGGVILDLLGCRFVEIMNK
jgi:hypothetical protein